MQPAFHSPSGCMLRRSIEKELALQIAHRTMLSRDSTCSGVIRTINAHPSKEIVSARSIAIGTPGPQLRTLSESCHSIRQTICRHLRRCRMNQPRPPHHLGGAHKHGATYSSHRAPSTYCSEYASRFFRTCGLASAGISFSSQRRITWDRPYAKKQAAVISEYEAQVLHAVTGARMVIADL